MKTLYGDNLENVVQLGKFLADEGYEDAVVLSDPDYTEAFVGTSSDGRAVYDYDLMVECLVRDEGMDAEEAIEYIDYNTLRAIPYMESQGKAPVVINHMREYSL